MVILLAWFSHVRQLYIFSAKIDLAKKKKRDRNEEPLDKEQRKTMGFDKKLSSWQHWLP